MTIGSVIFAFSVVSAVAQERTLKGVITDSEGAVISNARVIVHWDPAGSRVGLTTNIGIKEDREATTDQNGGFQMRLPWGFYDVFVSSMAFSPNFQKIRVKSDVNLRMKLAVDPSVSKELGGMLVSPAR
jgi:hypothetical protein